MIFRGFLFAIAAWLLLAVAPDLAFAQDEEGDVAINAEDVTDAPGTVRNVPTSKPGPASLSSSATFNSGNSRSTINDQDTALEAARKGLVLPFGKVLKSVKAKAPGDVVKVRLIYLTTGIWAYEVTVLDNKGRYTKLSVNAKTGALMWKKTR